MNIAVRFGTRNDIDALVEVERSDVETWYHFSSQGRSDQASYDELSSWERVMHGGPWMDSEALTKYWVSIERLGIIPLVAEIEGKVIGHLDIIFSEELPFGQFLYLDVLEVHKDYRRRGVATTLIREAERLARDRRVRFILVQPQQYEGPSGLAYRSCGFKKAFDAYSLETSIDNLGIPSEVQIVSIPQTKEAPLKTHVMICGWYNISAKTWDYGVNPDLEFSREEKTCKLALAALTGKVTYFFHLGQNLFDRSTGTLCLWAPVPLRRNGLHHVIQAAKTAASWLGVKSLTTKSIERYTDILEKEEFIVKSRTEPYLTKEL